MTDFDANQFLSGVGDDGDGDSDLVKLLRAKAKEAAKQIGALIKENTGFKEAATKATLDDTWKELKVPDEVREMYHGESTPDAIKTWFEAKKSLFNLGEQKPDPQQGQQQAEGQTQEPSPFQQQMQSVQNAGNVGQDPAVLGLDALREKGASLAGKSAIANQADLDSFLAELGFGAGGLIPNQPTM